MSFFFSRVKSDFIRIKCIVKLIYETDKKKYLFVYVKRDKSMKPDGLIFY